MSGEKGIVYTAKHTVVLIVICAVQLIITQIPQFFGILLYDRTLAYFIFNIEIVLFAGITLFLLYTQREYSSRVLQTKTFGMRFALLYGAAAVILNLYGLFLLRESEQLILLIGLHLPLLFILLHLPIVRDVSNLNTSHLTDSHSDISQSDTSTKSDGLARFFQFIGDAFLNGVLILLGGIVLSIVTVLMFESLGIELPEWVFQLAVTGFLPLLPLIAVFLVREVGNAVRDFTVVLAKLFLPLFLIIMILFIIAGLASGQALSGNRDLLITVDLLLVLVLVMILYNILFAGKKSILGYSDIGIDSSDKDQQLPGKSGSSLYRRIVILSALIAAVVIDIMALSALLHRFGEFGISANKLAALGENILMLGNLLMLAIMYTLAVSGKIRSRTLRRYQIRYLYLYAVWFAAVILIFPWIF